MACWVCAELEDWGVVAVEEDTDVVAGVCEAVAATLAVVVAGVAMLEAADVVAAAAAVLRLLCQNRIEQPEGAATSFREDP